MARPIRTRHGRTALRFAALALALAAPVPAAAAAPATAQVDLDTSRPQALAPQLSGFNVNPLWQAWTYRDARVQAAATGFDAGWLRFPAGTAGVAFDWQSGTVPDAFLARFDPAGEVVRKGRSYQKLIAVKGPVLLHDAAALAAAAHGASLIVCLNAFSDTPASAGALARAVRDQGIPVRYWELANEAYYFRDFFRTGTDYANAMRPYADAVRAELPGAKVSLMYSPHGQHNEAANAAWDDALAAYPDQYWDAISFHSYRGREATLRASVAELNGALAHETSELVQGYYVPRSRPGIEVLVTEFNTGVGDPPGPVLHTLYNGVYAAEFVVRLSSDPNVKAVGFHQLVGDALGIGHDHLRRAYALAAAGATADTTTWDFGFFPQVPGLALTIVNAAVNHSTATWPTVVRGGLTVSTSGFGGRPIPALYAQGYAGAGRAYVLLTNKSGTAHRVTVAAAGVPVTAPLTLTTIGGPDASLRNTVTRPDAVRIQSGPTPNPVLVPAYGVARVEWGVEPGSQGCAASTCAALRPGSRVTAGSAESPATSTPSAGSQ